MIALLCTTFWHLPMWLGIIAAIAAGGLLGLAMDAGLGGRCDVAGSASCS